MSNILVIDLDDVRIGHLIEDTQENRDLITQACLEIGTSAKDHLKDYEAITVDRAYETENFDYVNTPEYQYFLKECWPNMFKLEKLLAECEKQTCIYGIWEGATAVIRTGW